MNTPLFQQVNTDTLVWKLEKNYSYSIRCSHVLCIEDIVDNDHLRKLGYWSGIWKLKVPLKVNNLVWRICRDWFPTRVKLNKRGINCLKECVTCNDPHEDIYHIFFHCGTAIDAWRTTNIWHEIEPLLHQFDNAPAFFFFNLLEQVSAAAQTKLITIILWST